ncbi:MAG: PilW family protein [Planctomycetota bacterium]|jgi:type II secretory pathway pseudopilin PulG
MLKREDGFNLVELMVAMSVFILVIASSSNVFVGTLQQFKQQSKIAETTMEEVIGLNILRRDIEHAGFGIPWVIPPTAVGYAEGGPAATIDAPAAPPRAIIGGNNTELNASDRLVVKATNVAVNGVAQTWTRLGAGPATRNGLSGNTFAANDGVVVITPGTSTANNRALVVDGGGIFAAAYAGTGALAPTDVQTFLIYGITDQGAGFAMPFNRADYYISAANVPAQCAPNTGVLVKDEMDPTDGTSLGALPLIDCVADMQVAYRLDNSGDGVIDTSADTLAGLTARQIRERVKEVRFYILAHEGQMDPSYTHAPLAITLGENLENGFHGTNPFDVSAVPNYRWKAYTLVVRPGNLS